MQKKTKSKLSDLSFCMACILCSAYCIYEFINCLNKVSQKNETPIAYITYKTKTAQRKLFDDLIWDRLRQDSPIYNNDTIRTSNKSGAKIKFVDENEIELGEVTMIQVSLKDNITQVDFQNGEISVETTQNAELQIHSQESVVTLSQNSSLFAIKENKTNFSVNEGKAQIVNTNIQDTPLEIQKGESANLSQSGEITKSNIVIQSPLNNSSYLNFSEENLDIPFEWQSTQNNSLILEVSSQKDFSEILYEQTSFDNNNIVVPCENGNFYWRFKESDTDEEIVNGKFSVLYVNKPELISPKQDFSTEYRHTAPSIRFVWNESEYATSYDLIISDNNNMANPVLTKRITGTSCTINTLEKGTYYWQIVPYYKNINDNLSRSSEIRSFTINQNLTMKKPELQLPKNDSFITTKIPLDENNYSDQKIVFSWKNTPDAISYQIKIWDENSQGIPYINENLRTNYFTLDTSEHPLNQGLWYWSIDANYSRTEYITSEIRTFYASDSQLEQRTIFPPDNYKVSENRIQDLRFNWKTNISTTNLFEIATDRNFKNVVYSESTQGQSIAGKKINSGNYYWRISTKIADLEVKTEPKLLIVETLLPAPKGIFPINNEKTVTRPAINTKFSWKSVDDADYYNFKLANSSNPTKILYEQNFIENINSDTINFYVDLDNFEEDYYTWTVQAYRNETDLSSKTNSYIGTFTFNLRKLKPITLKSPKSKTKFDGVDAIKKPAQVEWFSEDVTKTSEFIIYKDLINSNNIVYSLENPKTKLTLPRLYEGTYYWTVKATTLDDLDISSTEVRNFTVGPIEKLKAPQVTEPQENKIFDGNYFKNNRSIKFKWKKVSDADLYVLRLYYNNSRILEKTFDKNITEYNFDSLTILKNGIFTWEIEAQSLYENSLFQNGQIEKHTFEIDLPEVKKIESQSAGIMYGK